MYKIPQEEIKLNNLVEQMEDKTSNHTQEERLSKTFQKDLTIEEIKTKIVSGQTIENWILDYSMGGQMRPRAVKNALKKSGIKGIEEVLAAVETYYKN